MKTSRSFFPLFLIVSISIILFPSHAQKSTSSRLSSQEEGVFNRKDSLRLLCIGNSYSLDATIYLPQMIADAGIKNNQYCIYCATSAGASLAFWDSILVNDHPIPHLYHMGGSLWSPKQKNWKIREILREPWDVIILQQASRVSEEYETYVPYIGNLLEAIHNECPNKDVKIGWHMTWTHAQNHPDKPYGDTGWINISNTTKKLLQTYDIPFMIPSSTSIQNARHTQLNDDLELTRDGYHIAYGIGRYMLALTWFEVICQPIFGCSMIGTAPSATLCSIDADKEPFYAITQDNYLICQECVQNAIKAPYSCSDPFTNIIMPKENMKTEDKLFDISGRPIFRIPNKGIYIKGKNKEIR